MMMSECTMIACTLLRCPAHNQRGGKKLPRPPESFSLAFLLVLCRMPLTWGGACRCWHPSKAARSCTQNRDNRVCTVSSSQSNSRMHAQVPVCCNRNTCSSRSHCGTLPAVVAQRKYPGSITGAPLSIKSRCTGCGSAHASRAQRNGCSTDKAEQQQQPQVYLEAKASGAMHRLPAASPQRSATFKSSASVPAAMAYIYIYICTYIYEYLNEKRTSIQRPTWKSQCYVLTGNQSSSSSFFYETLNSPAHGGAPFQLT